MFNEDEINLIGIVSDSELRGIANEKEMRRIICDALGITPLLEPLIDDLQTKGLITDGGTFNEKDIV